MAMLVVLCALDVAYSLICMCFFLVQEYEDQQAQLVSSLAPTAVLVQLWPSDQRAQMRREQQLNEPIFVLPD